MFSSCIKSETINNRFAITCKLLGVWLETSAVAALEYGNLDNPFSRDALINCHETSWGMCISSSLLVILSNPTHFLKFLLDSPMLLCSLLIALFYCHLLIKRANICIVISIQLHKYYA